VASSCSQSEEIDASFEEEAKGKKGRKGYKRSYNTTSFNYVNLPHSHAFTSVPIGNPPPLRPHFDGTYYTKWKFLMKMHLILLNASVWMVVCAGIDFLDEDEEPHFEQLHHNTQASSVLLSSLEKDEFDRVNGLKKAKDI
jgi:hypothetical protein